MKKQIDISGLWRYVSNFFDSVEETSREVWEFFWEGIAFTANDLIKSASRFLYTSSPERSYVSPTIDYYDLKIDILQARPTQFDSSNYSSRYILISKSLISSEPIASGRDSIRNDMIEISSVDYAAIRNIAIDQYVVVNANNPKIPTKYFKVLTLKGPTETGDRYFSSYVVQLYRSDLSYIPAGSKTTIYLTTGKVYKVEDYVIDVPSLGTTIANENEDGSMGLTFFKNVEFSFKDGYVEFFEDIIGLGKIRNGDYVYGKDIPVMEWNIYNSFGSMLDIPTWKLYNHDNISGKAAINSLISAVQNPSNQEEYQRALNAYYGLPIAPEDSEVLGLFESYDYEVTSVDVGEKLLILAMKQDTVLHNFLQPGTKLIIDGTEFIINIDYESVIDRVGGIIKVNDVTNVYVGTILNIKLPNRISLSAVHKPPASSLLTASHYTDGGEIKHLSDYFWNTLSKYPEMIVYDSDSITYNFDGYYHIKECNSGITGEIIITVDDYYYQYEEPRYNDYINLPVGPTVQVSVGKIHIPWPTHKYLLLKFEDGTIYKCYLDSPIDTIYDTGDRVSRYKPLARCISVIDQRLFPNWNEFNGFNRNNGIDLSSNILELIYTIPNTKYGIYMPN